MRFTFFFGATIAMLVAGGCTADDETGLGGSSTTSGTGASDPAAWSALPEVVSLGGRVLANPKVRPILYASDPHATEIEAFLAELASTPYFTTVTQEYGVGPLTVLPMIKQAEAAPAKITSTAIGIALNANTGVGAPWGETDAETIHVFLLPEGTTIDAQGTCCVDFDGFHDQANVNGVDVPYAVVCSCPGFDGPNVDDLQQITVAMSHEIVEASTDPFVLTNPAFAQTDDTNIIWTLTAGGEVADLCAFDPDSYMVPEGSKFMVQRSWSNVSAKAGKDPCLPTAVGAVFVAGAPVLTDSVSLQNVPFATRGVKIPVGQSKTIDVKLWSDVPSTEPWTVQALDFNYFLGGAANLSLSLDKATGQDGDVLKLTIQVLSKDPKLGGEAFFIVSQHGNSSSLVVGAVGN